jgi:UPF0755 protein
LKKLLLSCYLSIGLCLMVAVVFMAGIAWFAENPYQMVAPEQFFEIPSGQPIKVLAERLFKSGILLDPLRFRIYARLKGFDRRIRAGEYKISAAMTPRQILERFSTGKVFMHRLTVPEGLTLQQIAVLVQDAGLASEAKFIQAATDRQLTRKLGLDADSFEGYLFPETYYFPKGVTAQQIVTTMYLRFQSMWRPEWCKAADDSNLTVHQVVTLASIIEKETGKDAERAEVSSVFHNRLKRNMKLQTDPTVIYGMAHFDGNLTRSDLRDPTPYNTYVHPGLPPGPICNPGLLSIEAALFPAETRFLYFVSRNDGTHQFSTNLVDHNRAVSRYQLKN